MRSIGCNMLVEVKAGVLSQIRRRRKSPLSRLVPLVFRSVRANQGSRLKVHVVRTERQGGKVVGHGLSPGCGAAKSKPITVINKLHVDHFFF
jgi:hypothetical protein